MSEAIRTYVKGLAPTELGEEAFAASWAEGRKMTLERAVAFALNAETNG